MDFGDVVAVVPLKALDRAKGRLATTLDPGGRRTLACWMFDRVLDACLDAAAVRGVLVVAGDEAAAARGRARGVEVLLEPRDGLPAALAAADAATTGEAATIVVAADLPLAEPADVDAVCGAGTVAPCVVVTPTHDGGTGALLRRPPDAIPTAYGRGSADAHLRLADAAGIRARRLDVVRLGLDVDTAVELGEAADRDARLRPWRRPA